MEDGHLQIFRKFHGAENSEAKGFVSQSPSLPQDDGSRLGEDPQLCSPDGQAMSGTRGSLADII